jgi:hypothetical protein
VNGDGSIGASVPAASRFRVDRLSEDEQFTLLTGGDHPAIVGASLRRQVRSRILVAITNHESRMSDYRRLSAVH